ncbi:MAG TPA: VWA domain-containing protein [Candidatus Angelobacter sp.]|nr:VWA domain-containing protein [Candidatus Angelobacter sp.]
MMSLRSSFSLDFLKVLLTSIVLLCPVVVSTSAIAQDNNDPFSGRPATGAAGLPIGTDSRSGADVKGPNGANGRLTFRTQTVIVQVPAVVTDKSGHVLHGLTKDDFKVFEDGKERHIATFEEVKAANSRPATRATPAGEFSNSAALIRQPTSVAVIVLDTINTPFLDQSYGRREALKYLARNTSVQQTLGLVVIGGKGVQVLCGLGSEPATLVAALKKATGQVSPMEEYGVAGQMVSASDPESNKLWAQGTGIGEDPSARLAKWIAASDAVEGRNQQARSTETTLKAFLSLAWSLSGVPGRKSLIWITGSFPFQLASESSLPGSWAELYQKTMQALNNAQVSIYPVDARGLVGNSAFGGDETSAQTVMDASMRSDLNDAALASMRRFADMTGGRAFYNTNDLAGAIASAVDDSGSYYMLGYYLDTHNDAPGWRKLKVQVKRPDVVVRARSGFLETRLTADPEITHNADIGFALSSPFDSTAIPVTVKLGVTQEGDKGKVGFSLKMPEGSLVDESEKNAFDLDLVVQFAKDGAPPAVVRNTLKGLIPPQALPGIKSDGMIYNNSIMVPHGKYEVRFLIRDNRTGRIGTVSAPLTVN